MGDSRINHTVRTPMRPPFAFSRWCLQMCNTKQSNRWSLLTHLSVGRCPKCRDEILQSSTVLFSNADLERLDALEAESSRLARHAGHFQTLSSPPAIRAGKVVGTFSN